MCKCANCILFFEKRGKVKYGKNKYYIKYKYLIINILCNYYIIILYSFFSFPTSKKFCNLHICTIWSFSAINWS